MADLTAGHWADWKVETRAGLRVEYLAVLRVGSMVGPMADQRAAHWAVHWVGPKVDQRVEK